MLNLIEQQGTNMMSRQIEQEINFNRPGNQCQRGQSGKVMGRVHAWLEVVGRLLFHGSPQAVQQIASGAGHSQQSRSRARAQPGNNCADIGHGHTKYGISESLAGAFGCFQQFFNGLSATDIDDAPAIHEPKQAQHEQDTKGNNSGHHFFPTPSAVSAELKDNPEGLYNNAQAKHRNRDAGSTPREAKKKFTAQAM